MRSASGTSLITCSFRVVNPHSEPFLTLPRPRHSLVSSIPFLSPPHANHPFPVLQAPPGPPFFPKISRPVLGKTSRPVLRKTSRPVLGRKTRRKKPRLAPRPRVRERVASLAHWLEPWCVYACFISSPRHSSFPLHMLGVGFSSSFLSLRVP